MIPLLLSLPLTTCSWVATFLCIRLVAVHTSMTTIWSSRSGPIIFVIVCGYEVNMWHHSMNTIIWLARTLQCVLYRNDIHIIPVPTCMYVAKGQCARIHTTPLPHTNCHTHTHTHTHCTDVWWVFSPTSNLSHSHWHSMSLSITTTTFFADTSTSHLSRAILQPSGNLT